LVISVPDGDVWVLFNGLADENFMFLNMYVVRQWGDWEIADLPVTVPREKKVSQSDKRGTGSDARVAIAPEEP
jgi:hypothetical protein